MLSKVVPEVAVPLSASTECIVFQIFLKMSDHPWKETSSVRASLRCVCESTGWMRINLYLPLYSLILPVSVCVAGWMSA